VNKKTRNPIFISENLEHFGEIRFKRSLQKWNDKKMSYCSDEHFILNGCVDAAADGDGFSIAQVWPIRTLDSQ